MKVGIKDHMCNYFDDIIQVESLILIISYQTKNRMKIFLFMTFHAKPWLVQNICKLHLMRYIRLLGTIIELNI